MTPLPQAGTALFLVNRVPISQINGYLAELATSRFKAAFGSLEVNGHLSGIAEITMGQSPAGASYNEAGDGIVFYQGRGEFGWRYPTRRLFTTEPKRMALAGDVLMSIRAPVGDLNIAFETCCIGRGLAAIHSEFPSYTFYLMRSLKSQLDAYNGEGTVFGSINGKALKAMPTALPSRPAIEAYEGFAKPIDEAIRTNEQENRSLAQLRDALLPKLMSGEIDVSKVNLTQLNSHLAASSRRSPGHLTDLRYEWQGGNQIARTGGLTYRNFGILPRPGRGQASQRRFKRSCRTSPLPKKR